MKKNLVSSLVATSLVVSVGLGISAAMPVYAVDGADEPVENVQPVEDGPEAIEVSPEGKVSPEIQAAIKEAGADLDKHVSVKLEELNKTGLFDDEELNDIKTDLTSTYAYILTLGRSLEEDEFPLDSLAKEKKYTESKIDKKAQDHIERKKEEIKLEKEFGPLWRSKSSSIDALDWISEPAREIKNFEILPSKDKKECIAKFYEIRDKAKAEIRKANSEEEVDSIFEPARQSLNDLSAHYLKIIQPVLEGKYDPKFNEFYAAISKPLTPEEYKKIIELANGIANGTVEVPKNIPVYYGIWGATAGDNPFDIAIKMTPYAGARLAEYGRPNIPEVTELEANSLMSSRDFMPKERGKYKNVIAEYKKAHPEVDQTSTTKEAKSTQNISESKKAKSLKVVQKTSVPQTADVTAGFAAYVLGAMGLGLVSRKKK